MNEKNEQEELLTSDPKKLGKPYDGIKISEAGSFKPVLRGNKWLIGEPIVLDEYDLLAMIWMMNKR